MKQLLIEPFGGMAGDMFLAALCDLGDERFGAGDLEALAKELVPEGCNLSFGMTKRASIAALTLEVKTPESDHAPHRHLSDLLDMLGRSSLSPGVIARAGRVLRRIAEAEAGVHGSEVEQVHFHEVGAVDTLIDVTGACLALERLGVERVYSTTPYAGSGSVHCAHGEMPVPAPGTLAIMRDLPLRMGPGGERLTPTAAAILAEFVDQFDSADSFVSLSVGYGAGQRDPAEGPPNLLRVSLVESSSSCDNAAGRSEAWLLECNLDDATGEEIGFLIQKLRERGALEVWSAAVQMKKDRPGTVISALCRGPLRDTLEELCFEHSPTLGVRWSRVERRECEREALELLVDGERVRFKLRRRAGHAPVLDDLYPEYDDLARLADRRGVALRTLERELLLRAKQEFGIESQLPKT